MSNEPIPVDPSLSDALEDQIRSRALGMVQSEMGVLQTNYFQSQARVEALMVQRVQDLQLIEGLRLRVQNSESNVRILQDQWKEQNAARLAAEAELEALKNKRTRRRIRS